jgi:hypothetical protein
MEMMFAENRGFSSEDSQDEAAAAIIGGIFTVTMGALLEQLAKALNEKDAPAATFFKDCIDYMAMSMVSSYEENTKNFPKEVKYAIDMTLGMTAKQFSEWEQDPSFEELTNLGSSENPDVETMSEVVLDEAKDGYDDDFSVMYSSEDEPDWEIPFPDSLTETDKDFKLGKSKIWQEQGAFRYSRFGKDNSNPPLYDGLLLKSVDHKGHGKICDAKGCRKVMKVWGNTWNIPYYFCEDHYEEIQDRSDSWGAESFSSEGKSFFCDACEETLPLKLRNRSLKVTQEFGMGIGDICRPCVKRIKQYDAESFAAEVCSCTAEYCDYTGKCLDCGGDTYHSIIEVCHDCGEYNAESFGAEARQGDGVKRVCHRDLTMHCNKYSLGWVVCPACNQPYTDEDVVTDDDETDYGRMAESYADFFTQMEELLESTTIAGGWTLDATTDQEDPDAVTMVVKFKPTDPSTFFDIIE